MKKTYLRCIYDFIITFSVVKVKVFDHLRSVIMKPVKIMDFCAAFDITNLKDLVNKSEFFGSVFVKYTFVCQNQ